MAKPRLCKYNDFVADGGLAKVRIMRMNGLKDKEIFQQLGITASTFYKWKAEKKDFSDALKSGLNEAIDEAIRSLVSKFQKIELKETRTEEWVDKDGNKKVHTITTVKEIAPDTTALIFFLKAKAGWRDNDIITDSTAIEKLDQILKETQAQAENEVNDA